METKIDKDIINEHLRDSGRQIITDQAVKHDLTGYDLAIINSSAWSL